MKRSLTDAHAPEIFYALDSLPALLGDRQFKMLCEALGIDVSMAEARLLKPSTFDEGSHVARAIQRMSEQCRAARRAASERVPSAIGEL